MAPSRELVQAILAVLLVGGILVMVAVERTGGDVPLTALLALLSTVVGFYFGSRVPPAGGQNGSDSPRIVDRARRDSRLDSGTAQRGRSSGVDGSE